MNRNGKFNFINIEKVFIRNFSLFTKDNEIQNIEENIKNGVYCLAGANGLGKTTFLNIINYGLTGLVLEPNKEVFSPGEIVKSNKRYTERYFHGRLKAKDREKAEVEINFKINNKYYKVIRGFEDRDSLNSLEIYKNINNEKHFFVKGDNKRPNEMNKIYQTNLANDIGIGKFEYFVFFQLYILTFDENRRMIFWDKRASTNALSISFNYDLSDTDRILELKREMENLESHARNARWQATQIKKEKDNLIKTKDGQDIINFDELKEEYDNLNKQIENKEDQFNNIETEYDTLLKRQNIINSNILQLKIEYKKIFSKYSEPRSELINNKYINYAKNKNICFLCGAKGHYIVENIERKIHKEKCPICDTSINDFNDNDQNKLIKKLEELDRQIEKMKNELEQIVSESEAKKVELEKAEYEYDSAKRKLEKFKKENSSINFEETGNKITDDLITKYQERFEKEDKKSKNFYKKRDKLRPEYENLLKKVNDAYKEAEEYFVPLFKKFAKNFIGLDLNIFFKKKGKEIRLNFELLGTARTEPHQLSESQRFFLDIALRMALAVFLSKQNNGATLLIDTPEGSLDIAYESRVGKMFANFVKSYNQNIIMTANINASQLLIALAKKCGQDKMYFRRMLDWTDLTEIQKEGEDLFFRVYKNIEKALKGKNNE